MPESTRKEIAQLERQSAENSEGRFFVHLAEAYRRSGELEKAREVLHEGLASHSEYLSARIVLAQVEAELGNEEGAAAVWREVIDRDPQNELALRALAELRYQQGELTESLALYRSLQELGIDDFELEEEIQRVEQELAGPAVRPEPGGNGTEPDSPAAARSGEPATRPEAQKPPAERDRPERPKAPRPISSTPAEGAAAPSPPAVQPQHASRPTKEQPDVTARVLGAEAAPVKPRDPTFAPDASGGDLAEALVRLLEYRDQTFHAGSGLVRRLAVAIADELELPDDQVESAALAALIGNLAETRFAAGNAYHLPEREDPLKRDAADRLDLALSLQILERIPLPPAVRTAVRHQYERWDGGGYPDGLAGEEIPLMARVLAVARSAATHLSRSRSDVGAGVALAEVTREAGDSLDPEIVEGLRRAFENRAEHRLLFGLGGAILLLHPDEIVAVDLGARLNSEGFTVELARDTGAARRSLSRTNPKALILAASFPGAEMEDLIRVVRADARLAHSAVVAIQADEADLRVRLLGAGADLCLPSDLPYTELKASIEALLRRRETLESTGA